MRPSYHSLFPFVKVFGVTVQITPPYQTVPWEYLILDSVLGWLDEQGNLVKPLYYSLWVGLFITFSLGICWCNSSNHTHIQNCTPGIFNTWFLKLKWWTGESEVFVPFSMDILAIQCCTQLHMIWRCMDYVVGQLESHTYLFRYVRCVSFTLIVSIETCKEV